jgi:hypothetical protein
MVNEYQWNGYPGKIEKLFIRNLGGQPLDIIHAWITNENDILSEGATSSLAPSHFHHYIYPWKILPGTVAYTDDISFNPLKTFELEVGSNTWDVELFPHTTSTAYVHPFHRPTLLYDGLIWNPQGQLFSLPTGVGLTQPQYIIMPQQQSQLYGHKIRDYYRFPTQITLPPYSFYQNQIEFVLGCFPSIPGVYKGVINIIYKFTHPVTGIVLHKLLKVNLEMEYTNVNFTEVDKTSKDDIFSIEGITLEGQFIDLF